MLREFSLKRYEKMRYRYCGRSGLQLPEISLGAWETFGGYRGADVARDCLFRAFDLGITHFDLANTYGDPFGNAELVCGKVFKEMPRDEMIISTKAGWTMWPGPYGDWGSRKSILASVDQSLKRLQVDYVDIFYSHRPDPNTPLDETLGALDQIVRHGKALYAGISAYDGALTAEAVRVCQQEKLMRLTIHQPQYNMLLRNIEWDLLPVTQRCGMGVIVYCPLASGLLTDKYLGGTIPNDSRAAQKWGKGWIERTLTVEKACPSGGPERPGPIARPDAGADGAGVDPAPADHYQRADRRIERETSRGECRGRWTIWCSAMKN